MGVTSQLAKFVTDKDYDALSQDVVSVTKDLILDGLGTMLGGSRELVSQMTIEAYFDRWQIEVNHRDEKDLLGVGQAQVRSPQSVPRHPAFAVACYSLSLLATLRTFGPGRTSDYLGLPKWRKHSKRPSFLDILTILRKEYNETSVWPFLNTNFTQNLTLYANT